MKVDKRDRLFVAGGGTGTARVYDADDGDLLREYLLAAAPPTFVNDVTLTKRAAYFTDSRQRAAATSSTSHAQAAARRRLARCR